MTDIAITRWYFRPNRGRTSSGGPWKRLPPPPSRLRGLCLSQACSGQRLGVRSEIQIILKCYTVSRPLIHIRWVIYSSVSANSILLFARAACQLCSSAHQPKGTCKKTVTKPI